MKLYDYLPLYIGCQMMFEKSGRIITLVGLNEEEIYDGNKWWDLSIWNFKPILRHHPCYHPTMKGPEACEIHDLLYPEDAGRSERYKENVMLLKMDKGTVNYEMIPHLLSRGFDLFGLIDAGLAIDSSTLTPKI